MTKRLKIRMILFFILALTVSVFFVTDEGTRALDSPEIQRFILENLDETLIKKETGLPLSEVAYLTSKSTYVREELLDESEKKLDTYFEKVRNEGLSDEYVLTSATSLPLFDIDESSEYVVGCLCGPDGILDVAFAENNDEGVVLDEEIYDESTGLVYIRKSDLWRFVDGEILTDYVQIQTLRKYRDGEEDSFTVRQNSEGNETRRVVVTGELTAPDTEILLDIPKERIISEEDISVRINGAQVPVDESFYEISDDRLSLDISPANISEISVVIADEKGLFSPQTVLAYSTGTSDSSAFPTWKRHANVGDYCEFTAKWANGSGKNDNPGTYNAVQVISGNATGVQTEFYNKIISGDPTVAGWITGEYSSGKPNIYKPSSGSSNTFRDYKIKAGTISADASSASNPYFAQWLGSINCTVSMSCAEVKTAASVGEGTIDLSAIVSEVGSDYVLVTFCSCQRTEGNSSKPGTGQVLCGTFAISYAPEYAIIRYNANGGTVNLPYSLSTAGFINRNGALFEDRWELDLTKTNGLVNASSFKLTRPGFGFSGYWNTKPDGSGTSYEQDDSKVVFPSPGILNLYAIWTRNKGTVTFDLNGGEWGGEGMAETYEMYYDSIFAVPVLSIKDEPKKEGFAFVGWSDSPDGTVKFDFGDEIKRKDTEPFDLRLYAVWEEAAATDAVWSEYLSPVTYENADTGDMTVKRITPAKHHYYRFVGYYTENGEQVIDSEGNIIENDIDGYAFGGTFVNKNPIVLYAKFE
ncbi:MAG: InlB B-repeat-containing protein [Lachnospiraceae bacterium]|nr:InlB B-repeat-containing protein [Lachnospiraceae bacterium]